MLSILNVLLSAWCQKWQQQKWRPEIAALKSPISTRNEWLEKSNAEIGCLWNCGAKKSMDSNFNTCL